MKVVFVGMGAIGMPMALRIKAAGHDVQGVDVAETSRQRARTQGIEAVERYALTGKADVVVVMVATPQQLAALVEEALPNVAGQHWVIMSTVGPEAIIAAAAQLQQAGASVVDAPVTGGTARASTGDLVIFAAGEEVSLNHVAPVLTAMGRMKTVGNRPGDGQGIKVINQHLCAVHIVAAAEALNLAHSLGLDPAQVLPLVEGGAAGSWMLSDRGPRMLQGTDVEVSSAVNIFVKDSGLVADAAAACEAEVPLLNVAHARYVAAAKAGLGQHDDSRVIETW
ncbi:MULTISPECIES: NAD(P)-dependent oxidoreductase [unclassified Buttiauxella]|jgi:3-hydroxyisobutyrate dehydrogenase/putative dehydrogenase|uniref:NAD(P)-dependent oxidoreductase n=1 Tax=unclassified Buttiauxella TaxID=2634062 RepID=UPI00105D4FC5|nr:MULTISPECIES: NAD(P)-dependent oxidoreductase [unclassified Buttiauxella]MCE0812542.1 NAD(P)-dependent oxidoreductase [Buttiauxella sp. S04-F03]TDN50216.1 3-hydroxyisobutyrate dehydrogenase/putative dehydrogenase [Buttiauxella sp. JUb87]